MAKCPDTAALTRSCAKHRHPDGKVNTTRVALELGIPRTTVQTQVKRLGLDEQLHQKSQLSVEQRRIIQLQDENNRLRKQITDIHRTSLDDEAVREILGGMVAEEAKPPQWTVTPRKKGGVTQEVPITIWSDWHAGEAVSLSETKGRNEFNVEIFKRRVRRLVERTVDLLKNHGPGSYPGIVVNLLGDMVSGGLHPELAKTDEEEVIPATLLCRDMLVWALDTLIQQMGVPLYIPCTAGNHGRITPKPEYKRYVFKSFDWMIYQLLARHFAGSKMITFDIPDANEVHYRVFGRRYLAMHGDMMGVKGGDGIIGSLGPIARGEFKVGRQSSVMGRDYDTLLIGHWHQALFLPRVIVNNTLKGFDEYADKVLRAVPSTPSQTLWLEHPKWGRTMHREVFLEDPVGEINAPWVSVFAPNGKGA